MRIARTFGLGLGLILLLGLGASTFSRAQQTKDTGAPGQSRSEARERLKKHEFATTVRRLNEKKLDLAEAEKQYQLEAR
jgi:hypothetical protein